MPSLALSGPERAVLEHAVTLGLERAAAGLSEMIASDIRLHNPQVTIMPIVEVQTQLPPPEEEMVAIYLWLSAGLPAHVVLLFPPAKARELVDLLLGQPLGSTADLDELSLSALGEVGNVMGTLFANLMSDLSGQVVSPSTPAVHEDMVGAIIDGILADISSSADQVLLVETVITQDDHNINGMFLILPDPGALETVIRAISCQP